MAKVGDTIEHPVTGERLTFLETASSSDGAVLKMAFEMRPHAVVPGIHAHPRQEERFGLVSGRISDQDGEARVDRAGGGRHRHPSWCRSHLGQPVRGAGPVVVELRPALRAETYFETYLGLPVTVA